MESGWHAGHGMWPCVSHAIRASQKAREHSWSGGDITSAAGLYLSNCHKLTSSLDNECTELDTIPINC